jgi:D-alanyl-D-alanine carboxypeptidase
MPSKGSGLMVERKNPNLVHRDRRTRVLAACLASAVIALGVAAPAAAHTSLPPLDHAAVLADIPAVVQNGAPAFVVGGADESGQWSAAAGSSNVQTGKPASPDAAFRIGSISKTFVAVAILQLVAAGRIGLDTPIGHYLPGLLARGNVITIRELLEHRAGLGWTVLPTYYSIGASCQTNYDPVALVKGADWQLFEPGTSWSYSNPGYIALELVIQKVTGKPYQQVLRQQIVEPLGLAHTSFQEDKPVWPGPYLHGYTDFTTNDAGAPLPGLVDRTNCKTSIFGAAGSGISTTSDLITFMRALIHGRLLPDKLYRQMIAGVPIDPTDPTVTYGLGIFHEFNAFGCGDDTIGNTGGVFGYESELIASVDGMRTIASGVSVFPGNAAIDSSWTSAEVAEFCGASNA